MDAINTTLYVNIEYEFIGEIMFNPPILNQPEGLRSLVNSVVTNPNFIDGMFKSFIIPSSILLVVTTTVRAIVRVMVLRMAGRVAQTDEPI